MRCAWDRRSELLDVNWRQHRQSPWSRTESRCRNGSIGIVCDLNGSSHQVDGIVGVGDLPTGVCVDPVGRRMYVVNCQSGTVSVIR